MGFCGFFCARYNFTPLNLQSKYDGCVTAFGVRHVLSCSKVVLVIVCHNKLWDELLYLAR